MFQSNDPFDAPSPIVIDRRRFERQVWLGVGALMVLLSLSVGYLVFERLRGSSEGGSITSPSVLETSPLEQMVSSADACSFAVRSAFGERRTEPDLEDLIWSLDVCPAIVDWDQAFAEVSFGHSADTTGAVDFCKVEPKLHKTLLCQKASRAGLLELPSPDNEPKFEVSAADQEVVVGRVVGVFPGNQLVMGWYLLGENGEDLSGIPFTYRISGPLPAPINGSVASGNSGSVRVPGWSPGMTIRVEMVSIEDPSQVFSSPLTYVDES